MLFLYLELLAYLTFDINGHLELYLNLYNNSQIGCFAGIVQYCKDHNVPLPILLYMDGYKAHMGLAINDYCRENGIIPHLLKSNATQVSQPLDNNPYAAIQRIVPIMVQSWMAKNPGDLLDKYKKITEIAYKAFERVFAKKQTVIKGNFQITSG